MIFQLRMKRHNKYILNIYRIDEIFFFPNVQVHRNTCCRRQIRNNVEENIFFFWYRRSEAFYRKKKPWGEWDGKSFTWHVKTRAYHIHILIIIQQFSLVQCVCSNLFSFFFISFLFSFRVRKFRVKPWIFFEPFSNIFLPLA